ncbi:MAG: hypothetical protein DRP85_09635, partial [Candidatus Makaraimicrobium thalassicum]
PPYPVIRPTKPAPPNKQIDGVKCWPVAKRKEVTGFDVGVPSVKDTWNNIKNAVGCAVNSVLREFNDEAVDLTVKVRGGSVGIKRVFYNNQWHWEHLRNNLEFKYDAFDNIKAVIKGDVTYDKMPAETQLFIHDSYKIFKIENGYRWEDKNKNWKEYGNAGRMISYGSRSGVVANLSYEQGEDGKLIGISDQNDRQIFWFEYYLNGALKEIRDNVGRKVSYEYSTNQLTRVTDALNYETTYEYTEGKLTRKVDSAGRPTIVEYDDYGNVVKVVDQYGVGHSFEYDYDEAKQESYARITTTSGMVKEVWYDKTGETKRVDINGRTMSRIVKDGRALIVTDEKGNVTRKDFDEWDNLTKITYPDETAVLFEYEHTWNNVTKITDQRGVITTFEYNTAGNLKRKVEAVGTASERAVNFTYDIHHQLQTITTEEDIRTAATTTSFTYDEQGNVLTIIGPEGYITEFASYDNMGNVLERKDARLNTWFTGFDDMGRLVSETDPLGHITSYEYDGANNRTAVINAALKRFEFEYDDHNRQIKAIDPLSKYVTTCYNTDGNPELIVDQEGKESHNVYDNEGRLLKSIDGAGNQTIYHYDESQASFVTSNKPVRIDYPTFSRFFYYDRMQRLVREVKVLDDDTSQTSTYEYDFAGNIISKVDPAGNETQLEYDEINRLVKITDAENGITEKTYDDRDNVLAIKDPNDQFNRFEYDRNNRLTKLIKPMNEETTFEYDGVGNCTAVFDAKGQKIAFEYDAASRLIWKRFFSIGDHENSVKEIGFTYDELNRLASYDDGTTLASYGYDDLSRKTSEIVNYGGFSLDYSYEYYANGLKKSFTGPDDIPYSYSYDAANRLTGVEIFQQGYITTNSFQWQNPNRQTLPGGTVVDYNYNPLMQIQSIT